VKVCLFGASGRVGMVILENLLDGGHSVQALVRNPNRINTAHPNLQVFQGDIYNEKNISLVMAGTEAVISALNTENRTTLSESMPLIIHEMKKQGISRIITIGTAGILQARVNPEVYRFQSSESKRTSTKDAEEHLKAYLILKDSGLDWTVVCPTYLPTGERVGSYRFEVNVLPENPSSISVFDTGDFAYAQLESKQFIGARVGLTY
jgi:putative NADH-flavin reductase